MSLDAMTHGGPSDDQSVFAQAVLDPDAPVPAGIARANGANPEEAFAVYRNNVMSSLIEALADSFPITVKLIGDEPARAVMAGFARTHPPRTAILAEFGADFPDFLANHPVSASRPFLADLARLEMLQLGAYHAADAPCLDGATLATVDPETLSRGHLLVHPAVRLLNTKFAIVSVHAIEKAANSGADLGDARARLDINRPEHAIVTRPVYEPIVRAVSPGGYAFFAACKGSDTFADAAEKAFEVQPDFDLQATLALGLSVGAFRAFSAETPSPSPKHTA
ncbi:MAG: DNA-binding domain-containing protein [Pseudomonadota bacterium]